MGAHELPNVTDIRLTYDGGEVNRNLDGAFEQLLGDFGFVRWASGMNMATGVRDVAFRPWRPGDDEE